MDCPVDAALQTLPETALAVAFSGGLDSSVLLHALARRCPDRLEALHVDHGLQANSARWADVCRARAASWGIACRVLQIEVDPAHPGGLEAAARAARYQAMTAALSPGTRLALAHHREDQAETVLLRLLRRAGPRGLASMRGLRPGEHGVWIWRPLLDLPRAALQDYARRHGIEAIDDPMNHDTRFDRVYLRRVVLPALQARWPDSAGALAGSAALLAADDRRREAELTRALARCRGLDPRTLLRPVLAQIEAGQRRPLLQRWLSSLGAPELPAALLERLATGLGSGRGGRFEALRWGGWLIERHRDELRAGLDTRADFAAQPWDASQPLHLPAGQWVLQGAARLPWTGQVTPRHGGERIRLPGRAHRHALKDALQALGIPPWERRGLPLLWTPAGELVAVGDLLYAADFEDWLQASRARLCWTPT